MQDEPEFAEKIDVFIQKNCHAFGSNKTAYYKRLSQSKALRALLHNVEDTVFVLNWFILEIGCCLLDLLNILSFFSDFIKETVFKPL